MQERSKVCHKNVIKTAKQRMETMPSDFERDIAIHFGGDFTYDSDE